MALEGALAFFKLASADMACISAAMTTLRWIHFPKSHLPTKESAAVVRAFERHHSAVDSKSH